eukprot:1823068-Amphidinium_carterae.1
MLRQSSKPKSSSNLLLCPRPNPDSLLFIRLQGQILSRFYSFTRSLEFKPGAYFRIGVPRP